MNIKEEFNYRSEILTGINPKTKEDIKVQRDFWSHKGLDFSWREVFMEHYKDVVLSEENLKHIKKEIQAYLNWDDNGLEVDQIKEMELAVEILNGDNLTREDLIFICYVYDSTFYSYISLQFYRDEVEDLKRHLGDEYELYNKFYPYDEEIDE